MSIMRKCQPPSPKTRPIPTTCPVAESAWQADQPPGSAASACSLVLGGEARQAPQPSGSSRLKGASGRGNSRAFTG